MAAHRECILTEPVQWRSVALITAIHSTPINLRADGTSRPPDINKPHRQHGYTLRILLPKKFFSIKALGKGVAERENKSNRQNHHWGLFCDEMKIKRTWSPHIYGKPASGAAFHFEFCCCFPQNACTLHALESSVFNGFLSRLLHSSDLDLFTILS